MRAWVLDEIGRPLRVADVPEPPVRAGGVRLEVLSSHLPAYTREVVDGGRGYVLPTPLVLGVGGLSRVEAVGEEVFGVEPGDVVFNSSLLAPGDPDDTEILVGWTGVRGAGGGAGQRSARIQQVWRDGGFAERASAPKESLIRLPGADEYPDPARLAFLGWLSIAAQGLLRADHQPGQNVVIAGATGQLGGAATLVALARGASAVVVVGRNASALERLARLDRRVRPVRLTGDRGTDAAAVTSAADGGAQVVLDVLGSAGPQPTLSCLDALAAGATMVLVGGVTEDVPLPYMRIMRRRLTVRGSHMADASTTRAVWDMVRAGTIDLSAVGVATVGLDDPTGALDLAATTTGLNFVALTPTALTPTARTPTAPAPNAAR